MYHSRLCIGVSGTASPPPGKFNVATPLKYLHQNSRDITRSNCTPRSLLHLLTLTWRLYNAIPLNVSSDWAHVSRWDQPTSPIFRRFSRRAENKWLEWCCKPSSISYYCSRWYLHIGTYATVVKANNDREPTRPVYRGLLDISSPSPLKTHTIVAVLNVTLSLPRSSCPCTNARASGWTWPTIPVHDARSQS